MEPPDRPRLRVLICRSTRDGWASTLVDLLAWPYYQNCGWEWIALDPESERAWQTWRTRNPEAA